MGPLIFEVSLFVAQLILLAAVAIFFVRMLIFAVSGKPGAPFVPTPPRYAEIVAATLELSPGDVVYELGSGDGRFLLSYAKLEPRARYVGVERNPLLHLMAVMRKRFAGNPSNVELRRGDLYTADFSPANKMYLYLLDPVMHELQPKFDREFKGRVASRAFPFSRKQLSNVVALTERIGAHGQHLLFVYDF